MTDTIFSPSQTQDWSRCPTYWDTKKRWAPLPETWTPERAIGLALHAGVARYWRAQMPGGREGAPLDPLQCATGSLKLEWPPDAPLAYSLEGAVRVLERLLEAFEKWVGVEMPGALPVAVERDFGESRVDLVTEEPDGLVVTDWKYKHNLPLDRVLYQLNPVERSHQAWHYIWRVGQEYSRTVSRFRLVLLIGAPRVAVRHTDFTVEPDALAAWLRRAEAKWGEMERMRMNQTPIYRREEGCHPYGEKHPCPFLDACWRLHGDERKYETLYNRRT